MRELGVREFNHEMHGMSGMVGSQMSEVGEFLAAKDAKFAKV